VQLKYLPLSLREKRRLGLFSFIFRLIEHSRAATYPVLALDNRPTVFIFLPIADFSKKPANQMITDHIFGKYRFGNRFLFPATDNI
jgi:hypothetical protein